MDIITSLYFLQNNALYESEKVYELKYEPPPALAKTNMKLEEKKSITVEDIRGREHSFSFERNGFQIIPVNCAMRREDFDDERKVTHVYCDLIATVLKDTLRASRVQIIDYNVVRRAEDQFPISNGRRYEYNPPSLLVHIDTTPQNTTSLVESLNPTEGNTLMKLRYQYINIWKPLVRVENWPLVVCDPRTVNPEDDLKPRDLVYEDYVSETYQVHHRGNYKWYYLSHQTPQEAWLFLQSDSKAEGLTGVPHTSCRLPTPVESIHRESIELRALVFYDETEGVQTGH